MNRYNGNCDTGKCSPEEMRKKEKMGQERSDQSKKASYEGERSKKTEPRKEYEEDYSTEE